MQPADAMRDTKQLDVGSLLTDMKYWLRVMCQAVLSQEALAAAVQQQVGLPSAVAIVSHLRSAASGAVHAGVSG